MKSKFTDEQLKTILELVESNIEVEKGDDNLPALHAALSALYALRARLLETGGEHQAPRKPRASSPGRRRGMPKNEEVK